MLCNCHKIRIIKSTLNNFFFQPTVKGNSPFMNSSISGEKLMEACVGFRKTTVWLASGGWVSEGSLSSIGKLDEGG